MRTIVPGTHTPPARLRAGFTLVEMLVSVTLVLLMMMMFAQIFEIASGIHVKVRGITRNDQRTRILSRTLRSDLDKRTMRHTTPFRQNEHLLTNLADRDLDDRQGYFSVSENDPGSDLDDVLQFTARTSISLLNVESSRFSGKSISLAQNVINQPDYDDGVLDNAAESIAAEISYFLRSGTLFRRVLLLRQPAYGMAQPTEQPSGNPIVFPPTLSFWNNFDFSAHYEPNPLINSNVHVRFHGLASLDNSGSLANYPLGFRRYRFGHDHVTGQPREFTSIPGYGPDNQWGTDDDSPFIGRFTHEETSNPQFLYPAALPNPMNPVTPLTLDAQSGVVTQFPNGPRQAEDILMTNVHSFDVKILRDSVAPWGQLEVRDENFDTGHPRDNASLLAGTLPGTWMPGTNATVGTGTYVRSPKPHHYHMGLCFRPKISGSSGTVEPIWPKDVGQAVIDGSIVWEAVYDPYRAVAIQVIIRFLDLHSGHMRQTTILHSLTN